MDNGDKVECYKCRKKYFIKNGTVNLSGSDVICKHCGGEVRLLSTPYMRLLFGEDHEVDE